MLMSYVNNTIHYQQLYRHSNDHFCEEALQRKHLNQIMFVHFFRILDLCTQKKVETKKWHEAIDVEHQQWRGHTPEVRHRVAFH